MQCCMRIGARHDKPCAKITTVDWRELVMADEIRYLGVFIMRATKFKCSVDKAKRSFYRAANSIFARVGRLASEEVTVQLFLIINPNPALLLGLMVYQPHLLSSLNMNYSDLCLHSIAI